MKTQLWISGKNGSKTRNPERITEVLDALRVYWEMHPELRLGQLVRNVSESAQHGILPVALIDDDEICARFTDRIEAERKVGENP